MCIVYVEQNYKMSRRREVTRHRCSDRAFTATAEARKPDDAGTVPVRRFALRALNDPIMDGVDVGHLLDRLFVNILIYQRMTPTNQ